jgi:hypothetical protein
LRGKITKRSVDALKLATDGAEAVLWDSELKGFGARVQRGGAKSYVLHYRVGAGRSAPLPKLTIGRHGSPWTPETARREAKRLLGLVEDGADPAADKVARKEAPTMAELAERFFAQHAEAKRKGSTAAEYRRLLDKIILPALGRRKVADVSRAEVTRLHHANRVAPYQANRVLAVLSKMFSLAERCGRTDRTRAAISRSSLSASACCRRSNWRSSEKRSRPMTARPMPSLRSSYWCSPARALAKRSGSSGIGLILSAARRGSPTARPAPRPCICRRPRYPSLPNYRGSTATRTIIAGAKESAALVNLEKPWRAIRAAARLDDVRLHDLRHAFASVAASSGMGLPIIGKMLGHTQPTTTARYAHLASDPIKAAAAAVAGKIAAAMASGSDDAGTGGVTILPLRSST